MIRFPSFVYPFPDNSGCESTLNYLRVTLAPSASSLVLMSSASSLEAPSLTTLGAPSTTSLASFKPADQRARSTVSMNALKEGIRVWDRDINRFLTSDYVPLYNPVEEYLYDTGRWDGKDRIRALADLVPCHNPFAINVMNSNICSSVFTSNA